MFQSTPSWRSATITSRKLSQAATVSIHALLAECDIPTKTVGIPCSGFNPRTPCGVRLSKSSRAGATSNVSIHALLAECDHPRTPGLLYIVSFNPRTPCGVRLINGGNPGNTKRVSIHALLAECDLLHPPLLSHPGGFNPRTPCGVRRLKLSIAAPLARFQSTHSLRSATQPTLYITTQQSKSYFAPTSLKRPSLHGYTF